MNRSSISLVWRLVTPIMLLHFASETPADTLTDHDNGPLTGIFGFPDSTEGSELIGHRLHGWGSSLIIASHNIDEARGGESLRLDGESSRLAFTYRYGISDKLEIGIEAPYVWHRAGFLDSIIDGWHDFFGLPDGPRGMREHDQLEIFYADSQATLIDAHSDVSGIGDIRILAGWLLTGKNGSSTALRLSFKLPTGDSDKFLGSGSTDSSLGLAHDAAGFWGKTKLSGFYRANVTRLGKPDRLADRYNDFVGQLSFGLGYQVHRNVGLRLQSRIRSAVYDSEIDSLGAASISLTFGANFHLSDRYRLSVSLGEDIKPDSAPDVTFQLALHYSGQN